MMLSTSQPIGIRPKAAPYAAARPAIFTGMPKARMATARAAAKPKMAAQCAFISKIAIAPSSTTTGIAAANVDNQGLPNGS